MIGWLAALAALASAPPEAPTAEPSAHTLIYYNARMALREGQSLEAVKLWLLRNALEKQTGTVSPYDADFRSVTWAALGQAGICQDGYHTDDDGAGLWPLAMHNWVVRNLGHRKPPKRPKLFEAFDLGQQQRFVSIDDVLSGRELRTVHLFRGRCLGPRLALTNLGEPITADLTDRHVAAELMHYLLLEARDSLAKSQVRGASAIEARIFDVDLQLTAMAAQDAKHDARDKSRHGREIGMSREAVAAMAETAARWDFPDYSEPARILRACVAWPPSEWMALTGDRRAFLFDRAREFGDDPVAMDAIALGVLDGSIAAGDGAEVDRWIPRFSGDPAEIWGGERGQRLLALDRESGFHERAVITLQRGVHSLEEGDLPSALRSLAYALQLAPESRAAEEVQSLSRRWLSYAAAQFAITDELLATLQELVPRRDYAIVLEDLMWRAALRADRASFALGVHNQVHGGALERRIALLEPLAAGNVGKFTTQIKAGLTAEPTETLKFLDQLVQRLELEDAAVRAAQAPTLAGVRRLLVPLTPEGGNSDSRGRTAAALVARSQAILEGLGELGPDASAHDRARSLGPADEVFAGAVRLAPADPLPWPFLAAPVQAPSIFAPITLTPVEWPGADGGWVFGWSLGG